MFGVIAVIALFDWMIQENVSLGFLYVFPMLLCGYWGERWKIAAVAALCALLRENFAPWAWQADASVRVFLVACTFSGAGLFVSELVRARRQIQEESVLRQEAEQQLRVLVEGSPAAILTVDARGGILMANQAAHRLLAVDPESLTGQPIGSFLPVLGNVLRSDGKQASFRSTVECTGRRRSGEVFLAHIWFSTYQTRSGPRLAAIVSDGSEELRDREGLSLHSVMTASQLLVRAALHEVRNLCAAAAVAHASLGRVSGVEQNETFRTLGTLVRGLEKIASSEVRWSPDGEGATADLSAVLDELRIVIEPSFHESGIAVVWDVPHSLPPVRGDHHGLLQVFLNLAQNSQRAMLESERKELIVAVSLEEERLMVRFQDTGRGVPVPDRLFQPLQPGAEATGLGLYVSRAIVRSFTGDLRFQPQALGSCFTVQLAPGG